ncbi:hypothetical protein [Defluviitalea phaphyphila]|uniref:hypothetical protein n=1 Tax=Defluviitalea phaphyphila TaxID=1473580 RepID=UPI000731CEDD|nr:hypothetical protein [Defluviitalea phaphyphila]
MSDKWIEDNDRLLDAVNGDKKLEDEIIKSLGTDKVEKVLFNINGDGTIQTFRLDKDANRIGPWP